MIEAPIPKNEEDRLKNLLQYQILDTEEEELFNEIAELASTICNTPIALISLIDSKRQWFKAHHGTQTKELPRSTSFCGHAILNRKLFTIEDTLLDERFKDNPLVTHDPLIRFYAGAPLVSSEGYSLGTLCVIDHEPKKLNDFQQSTLQLLSKQVIAILDLKISNLKLQENNSKLKTLYQNMSEGMILIDSKNQVLEFNRAALEITGLSEDQIYGRPSNHPKFKTIQKDGSPFLMKDYPAMKSLATGKAYRNEIIGVQLPNDEFRWISVNSSPIFKNGNSTPSEILSTFNNITELVTSEIKFKTIFENSPLGMVEVNSSMKFVETNPTFQKIFGYSAEELKSKTFLDLTDPKDLALSKNEWNKMLKEGKIINLTKRYVRKNGECFWAKICARSYLNEAQKQARVFSVVEDITQQVNLEENLRRQEALLIQASKMSSLGEMAAGIAHEINNPLTIITVLAGLIKKSLQNPKEFNSNQPLVFERLSKIEDTIQRISKIVKGLRNFSRKSNEDIQVKLKFSQVIEDTMALCHEKMKFNSIQVRIDHSNDPFILGRPEQLSQVLLNLLNNSFDAISSLNNPWIEIKTSIIHQILRITITDSGPGIPPEIQSKLMQPFFTTKEMGKGTGLGLSISHGIIDSHGGKFYYDPHSSHTTFVIELPIYE
jgi:PAS domain S-box-containing protein